MTAMFVYGMPDSPRYALVKGRLRDWLCENGIPAMWSPPLRGWRVRLDRLGDVLALAERDGIRVHMKGAVQ
ncbi:hypothetical protein [Intrasporangium chromatireducens]|nr:hypothetical protein [Intrasporangium chromatireducens]